MNALTSMTQFGRGAVTLRAKSYEPLSLDAIAAAVPAIFAEAPHESRSAKYTYISTRDMLEAMLKEDFGIFEVRQGGTKFEDRRPFTKHMIKFRHKSQIGPAGRYYNGGVSQFGANAKVGDSIHEIILRNAHDGTASWEAMSGWHIIRCLNGLIVHDASKETVSRKIPHRGNVAAKVIEASYAVINEGGEQARLIEHMAGIPMNRMERLAFAEAAMALRWDDESGARDALRPELVVTPRRPEDTEPNLWRVFNVAQENLIRGELPYTRQQDIRKDGEIVGRREVHAATNPVRTIEGDVKLNRALWVLTQKMAELKGA